MKSTENLVNTPESNRYADPNIFYITYPDGTKEKVFKSNPKLDVFGINLGHKLNIQTLGWVIPVGVTQSGFLCVEKPDGVRLTVNVTDEKSLKAVTLEIKPSYVKMLARDKTDKILDVRDETLAGYGVRFRDRANFEKDGWGTIIGCCQGQLWYTLDTDKDMVSYFEGIKNAKMLRNIVGVVIRLGESYYLSEQYGLIKQVAKSEKDIQRFHLIGSKEEQFNENIENFANQCLEITDASIGSLEDQITSRLWISLLKNDVNSFKSTLKTLSALKQSKYNISPFFYKKYGGLDLITQISGSNKINFLYEIVLIFKGEILIPIETISQSIDNKDYKFVMLFLENQLFATKKACESYLQVIFPLMRAIPKFLDTISSEMFEERIYEVKQLPEPLNLFYNELLNHFKNDIKNTNEVQESKSHLILAYLKQILKLKKYSEVRDLYLKVEHQIFDKHLVEFLEFVSNIFILNETKDSYISEISPLDFRFLEEVCIKIRTKLDDNNNNKLLTIKLLAKIYLTVTKISLKNNNYANLEDYFPTLSKFFISFQDSLDPEDFMEVAQIKQDLMEAQIQENQIISDDVFSNSEDKRDYLNAIRLKTILTYYEIALNLCQKRNIKFKGQSRYEILKAEFFKLGALLSSKGYELDTADFDFEEKPLLSFAEENMDNTLVVNNNNNNNNNNSYSNIISLEFINSPVQNTNKSSTNLQNEENTQEETTASVPKRAKTEAAEESSNTKDSFNP